MIRFTSILCPIDDSPIATRALAHAAALAAWYDASLHVLHVLPDFAHHPGSLLPGPAAADLIPRHAVHDQVRAAMHDVVASAGAIDRHPTLHVRDGYAHRVIVDCATELSSSLLVIGTHGRSGFSRLFLGSVAERVVRTAPCPVLTVPPHELTPPTAVTFERILCPIDFSPASIQAFGHALDLARQANGRVTVLHALEYMDLQEPGERMDAHLHQDRTHILDAARERLHALVAGEPRDWCEVEEVVVAERAWRAVLDRLAGPGADLVVMGAQGRGGADLLLYGSNTQRVVRAATCPVLTVRA